MQDVFSQLAREKLDSPEFLNASIQEIARINPSIKEFKIVIPEEDAYRVIASLHEEEIGNVDVLHEREYRTAKADTRNTFVFPDTDGEIRHWRAVRAIEGSEGRVPGVILTTVSMEVIDALFRTNVRRAYFILFLILFAVAALLVRHARIIDYAVLYRKLKEIDQMKDDFVSMAAHELKTPLAVIRGYISLLSPKIFSAEDGKYLKRINMSIDQLNSLISDILDVARIQQGRISFDLKNIRPNEAVAEVVDLFTPLAQEKHLSLTYERKELPLVWVDGDRFRQILVNLVGNAIKYTPRGSITITMVAENGMVTVRVSDTGLGISAEDQKHLFGKFFRVRSQETNDIRGTGLGLWITAELVKQMSGVISVESIKGKGSVFAIVFPIAR